MSKANDDARKELDNILAGMMTDKKERKQDWQVKKQHKIQQ